MIDPDVKTAIVAFKNHLPEYWTERDREQLCWWLDREDSLVGTVYRAALQAGYTLGYVAATFDGLENQNDKA